MRLLLPGCWEVSVVLAAASFWSASYSEASRAAAGFQVVSRPPLCNDWCRGMAELESLFMRQSTVAFERISCISCSCCAPLEIWRIFPASYLAVTCPVSGCCMRKTET